MGDDLASLVGALPAAIPVAGFVVLVIMAVRLASAGRREAHQSDERLDKAQRELDDERVRRRVAEDDAAVLRRKLADLTARLDRRGDG